MKIQYSARAIRDLRAISTYLKPRSKIGSANVRAAIRGAIEPLKLFPRAGTPQTAPGVRKLVAGKYPYLIYYTIDEALQVLTIVTILHASRDREF